MKTILSILLLSLHASVMSSGYNVQQQNPKQKWNDKYYPQDLTAIKLVNTIDKVGFVPKRDKMVTFKSVLLQLGEDVIKQLNISSWYWCTNKHDEYFTLYNINYKPVSKTLYDEDCKALISLMILDGLIANP